MILRSGVPLQQPGVALRAGSSAARCARSSAKRSRPCSACTASARARLQLRWPTPGP